ncbi:hypothetical protein BDV24DRAFT_137007 [Aspergillus arachidicola]|uniref:Uncharacterized protein n=1 Tax=Aspergillus arachidicola TaxID=656916 RepID=A0A5N6Y0T9_9EURO|nr:hypothetical protein BDV24DRAFT_137007 [Aspergillus arachidicola]
MSNLKKKCIQAAYRIQCPLQEQYNEDNINRPYGYPLEAYKSSSSLPSVYSKIHTMRPLLPFIVLPLAALATPLENRTSPLTRRQVTSVSPAETSSSTGNPRMIRTPVMRFITWLQPARLAMGPKSLPN